ncbi:serine carboxypeptidase-like 12 [Euphorbia peplus]|nr:serine carboxypeptidase-like 12 [Euphorbia peplus]
MDSISSGTSLVLLPLLLFFLLLLFSHNVASGRTVTSLPGFPGVLPFNLETGYVTVNASELFYMFVESQGNPKQDVLLLYLIGGPGCSALNGFFFQTGPLLINTSDYSGGLPQLYYNPYSWTKSSSIIFIESPVGTGYSYSTTPEGYLTSDIESTAQLHIFLRKWLSEHPEYVENRFFIASDSYVGLITPLLAYEIMQGNEAGLLPSINFQGIISGSPHIDSVLETDSIIPIVYQLALIPKTLYESAESSCNGSFSDVTDAVCEEYLDEIDYLIENINTEMVLEPQCIQLSPKPIDNHRRRFLKQKKLPKSRIVPFPFKKRFRDYWCPNFEYELLDIWANSKDVQDALYVRRGTKERWYRCNITLQDDAYTYDFSGAIDYYKNLTTTGTQVLLYTADHDLVVPYMSTMTWIESLGLTADYAWRPWFVQGQVAGYTFRDEYYGFRLTFATLKGSGHSPTQYKPLECYNMFERWIHHYNL